MKVPITVFLPSSYDDDELSLAVAKGQTRSSQSLHEARISVRSAPPSAPFVGPYVGHAPKTQLLKGGAHCGERRFAFEPRLE